ncbi:RNA-directed DNA polymerase [Phytophthora palmivora]|uniref:RNA-directed DNA polymerase n=1 Tax=Phytophthora palmivora TaxID=4796 RepID=A0A2P4XV82_9STRA|nr:RNA-directed DNA polymerase [Phytophthora palmivora]
MSLDFVFGLPADDKGNTGILVFVCRLRKMVHLAPVRDKVAGKQAAQLFLDSVFPYHGLPETIVSDRDPRFTGEFWDTLFQLLGTKLTMSTADHPQTDGQTERVNRVLEDTLRSICAEAPRSWSDPLPMVEFAFNNAVHASTGFTPFYLNGLRPPGAANLAE